MKPSGYYTSGEFAKMAHITIRTVRYYDKENILKPSFVNESGARFYTDEDFAKLQQILLLKYLGFSLDDIRQITIGDLDRSMLKNSLKLQLKLVKDRIEQMELVEKAIEDTTKALEHEQEIDWNQMLNLIHLTNMENTLKTQYENSSNISARIRLHKLYSVNKQGWFPWIYEQCDIRPGMNILELGCGSGALWRENREKLPIGSINITLNDISEGMLRDTKRELEKSLNNNDHIYFTDTKDTSTKDTSTKYFDKAGSKVNSGSSLYMNFHAFDCHDIPYDDDCFDLIIANHVLFYCDDLSKALSEIRRVLKPGGTFICSTYGAAHMKEITTLVQKFNSSIILSADKLYERFGLDNGAELLAPYFSSVTRKIYEDELIVDTAEPLIEYILSCHGNQNQYLLDRYKDFRTYVERKTRKNFHITKYAGVFVCTS
jgi:DNA-binding transcriptional MerR regulator/ubiquinone/menaquinone biosynthesis C-methylase UbiE